MPSRYGVPHRTPSDIKFVADVPGRPVSNVGQTWDVQWVPIDDPDARVLTTYAQGAWAPHFGAQFRRLEGCWWGDQTGYFLSTNGGPAGEGQVFEYNPIAETLKLIQTVSM